MVLETFFNTTSSIETTIRKAEPKLRCVLCAGHVRQLGGESPLPIPTEEKG
jgi:hypothetical protein